MAITPPNADMPASSVLNEPEILPAEDQSTAPPRSMRRRKAAWAVAPATHFLVAVNCLVFLAMVAKGISPVSPTVGQLMNWGANNAGSVLMFGEWWRVLTAMFLHVGIIHL